ncbi:MAG: hypothetical protein MZU79_06895 [Anaerotruncus sp.]|nr:hypothetical protein [Anaerotruncus sp.]
MLPIEKRVFIHLPVRIKGPFRPSGQKKDLGEDRSIPEDTSPRQQLGEPVHIEFPQFR